MLASAKSDHMLSSTWRAAVTPAAAANAMAAWEALGWDGTEPQKKVFNTAPCSERICITDQAGMRRTCEECLDSSAVVAKCCYTTKGIQPKAETHGCNQATHL